MAIIIEEDKNKSNIIGIAGWVAFIAIVLFAVYYIFFAPAESVIVIPPANLTSITPISEITLYPQDVANNKLFQSLQQYVSSSSVQGSAAVGRANPLIQP